MKNKQKRETFFGVLAIVIFVPLMMVMCSAGAGDMENDYSKARTKVEIKKLKVAEKKLDNQLTTTTISTTIVPRETIYVTNPADAAIQAKLDKCRAALDKYSNAVETLRQTLRTYDDATMTNNSELANIALNSNVLSVIPGLAAEYERCYQ